VVSLVGGGADAERRVGSGFLVSSDGYLVTTIQVVAGIPSLSVLLPGDAKAHDAHVVDYDCQTQLVLVKADGVASAPRCPSPTRARCAWARPWWRWAAP